MISSVNCHSSKISKYVDYHLQTIVREIPSYIKDTSDFLCQLKPITEVPENSYTRCRVTLCKHSEFWEDKSSKNIPWKLYEEDNSYKGNNYFLSSHSTFKQFYIQLKKLFSNQRMCNRNYLCNISREYIHRPFWAKIHISINRRKIINIFQMHR